MNRRDFLKFIPAAGIAPWVITKAGVLMPVRRLIVPHDGERLWVRYTFDRVTGKTRYYRSLDGIRWFEQASKPTILVGAMNAAVGHRQPRRQNWLQAMTGDLDVRLQFQRSDWELRDPLHPLPPQQ